MTEAVKEKLAIPKQAGQRCHREVDLERCLFRSGGQFDVFAQRLVAQVEVEAIHGGGHEGAAAGKDIDHVAFELSGAMGGGESGDGFACVERKPEHGGQKPGEHAEKQPLAEVELLGPISRGLEIGILEPARQPGHQDAAGRDGNPGQHPARAFLCEQLVEFAIEEGRQKRAEHTRDPDGNGIGDRKPDVTDRDPEGRAADSVDHA